MNIYLDLIAWSALMGGLMIGAAVAALLLINGRIAGISGIVGDLCRVQKNDRGWRMAFIIGLVLSPVIWQLSIALPEIQIDANNTMLAIAGLLVGYGTRLGFGCTSGHGVCGLSRGSLRSMVATLVFILTGMATVYGVRYLFA